MNDRERAQFERLQNVAFFYNENEADFAKIEVAKTNFERVVTAAAALEQLAASKISANAAGRAGTVVKSAAREELRADLSAIAETARAMAIDQPGLNQKFRAPRNANDQELLASARAFAIDAAPLEAEFINYGLPADFLKDLQQDTAAFEAAFETPSSSRAAAAADNAQIDGEIEIGNKAIRRLDAIVRNLYRNNPAKLAAWTTASHLQRQPRAAKPDKPPKA